MLRILLFFLPLFFVVLIGPAWLASKRRGGSTWFPAQIITLLGMLGALAALEQGAFGDVLGSAYMLIVVAGAAVGLLVAWIILPRAKK